MAVDIAIPSVGESITEGTLARWLKQDGAQVEEGEPLFELETDKATGEVPSPATGTLRIKTKPGQTVAVGSVVGRIEPGGDGKRADAKAPAAPKEAEGPAPPSESKSRPPEKEAKAKPPTPPAKEERPAAGPKEKPEPSAEEQGPPPVEKLPRKESPPAPAAGERETRKPMSRIRRTIADNLVRAQQTAAILTTFNEADLSEVIAIRGQFKEIFRERHGTNLGFMSFFVKASVEALKAFPIVNSRIEGDEVVSANYYDIGVAVSTERGLMVPVIRDADRKSFADLEKAIADFAQKAREGKIAVEDLRGGTFTITNGGVFGSLLSTPILNPPQSAILGMHTIHKRPVVVEDQVVVRPMMYLALSYDHRLIDGREAVLFLLRIKELIEHPERLLLGL